MVKRRLHKARKRLIRLSQMLCGKSFYTKFVNILTFVWGLEIDLVDKCKLVSG